MSAAHSKSNAEKNAQVLKSLLRQPCNKQCADCKSNEQPRWASWNLGVFICIRCSGIHRSLGVHISRVKSVDLDSWTDEQTAQIKRWGNARANKYWEAKLSDGHVPSDSKIASFIRTKYEFKKWALSPVVPDPTTLNVPEEEVANVSPLSSIRPNLSTRLSQAPLVPIPSARPATSALLETSSVRDTKHGFETTNTGKGLHTTASHTIMPSASAPPASNKQNDLKSSILSLYAAPKPQSSVGTAAATAFAASSLSAGFNTTNSNNLPSRPSSAFPSTTQNAFVADKWRMPLHSATGTSAATMPNSTSASARGSPQSNMGMSSYPYDSALYNSQEIWK
ncbi:GTPase activating protein [Schizosaccharomyces japonicus yFS275]|uniref:GTPase activating protein n=1 Tax=Schizosaccharomyces japonicus (strain yFS275 / FY16936) TaxID=402676 RepID=B6JYE0_SCHJY|nr:GTPase activating protein [Schizosaccharomyces japonicus yFS275]EEB06558.2 GTPase activating protein [Schizosaccharomyces japonicus yFS275]